jgi:predicted CxxxxCH...CXXCH cytochrome family protein
VHRALPGVGTNCATCHTGASHNNLIDLGILTAYNAKTGTATENPNGTATCSNVSCHGGKVTPDWMTGTINVNTQCTSCHASGTAQFNGYSSGRHTKHVSSEGVACVSCHNTSTLAANHFGRLDTSSMEGPAAATVGGGSTRVTSYNASTKTCATSCHGNKGW